MNIHRNNHNFQLKLRFHQPRTRYLMDLQIKKVLLQIIQQLQQEIMFSKQIEKINQLLSNVKDESSTAIDSIALISNNISRPKTQSNTSSPSAKPKYQTEITLIKQGIPKKYQQILEKIFRSKCKHLSIDFNQKNWDTFIKTFLSKNNIKNGDIEENILNLNDLYLGENSTQHINFILKENQKLLIIKLNKNSINPNNIYRLQTLKELSLCNCRLGNDSLEQLFTRLHNSIIQKINLSSPQLRDRNQLTKYTKLISLIHESTTLHTLGLSNIQIRPDSTVIQSCRGTFIKHLDLSDNTNVKGICPTLQSLNISRNNITIPFIFPMLPNELNHLNLSYNKIPYYHFKQFLKCTYFPTLKTLILDHIKIDGEASAIQFFLQQSLSLSRLSVVDCDFSQTSYTHVINGIRYNRSLQSVDITRNRVMSEKIAESISQMLQGSYLKQIRMRHCDIKDRYGKIIFKNLRKNKTLQKIDMMNNLLGDQTAKSICEQLKYAKNIVQLSLAQNIIKYKDMQEINSYLQGNKYFNIHQLDKEYGKLVVINNQIQQANLILSSEGERIVRLEKQTENLHEAYLNIYKQENSLKKEKIKEQIYGIRDLQNQLSTDITLYQSLPSMTEFNSFESRKQSFIENSPSFLIHEG